MALFGALGFLYGAAIRAWMRLVSDNPEFTWEGTIFIVGAFTITFTLCGLVSGGRARGWKGLLLPARAVTLVVALSCFMGAGVVMLPTIVPAALALARTDWPRWLRLGLGGIGLLTTLMIVAGGPGELGWARLAIAYALYLGLVCVEVRVLSEPFRPSVGRLPLVLRIAAGAAAVVLLLGVLMMTVGFATA
jgi:hypothetical protein